MGLLVLIMMIYPWFDLEMIENDAGFYGVFMCIVTANTILDNHDLC